jgi:hypothetical protein
MIGLLRFCLIVLAVFTANTSHGSAAQGLEAGQRLKQTAHEPVRVILDTDMNFDLDDMLALAMLHALQARGEAKIVAVTCSGHDRWGPPFVDLIDTFYGSPDIPIGMVSGDI